MNKKHIMRIGLIVASWIASGCGKQSGSVTTFQMTSRSMSPTLAPGDQITVECDAYAIDLPKRWDVIAFRPLKQTAPNEVWCMRVVGLPGEQLEITKDGKVLVNGIEPAVPPNLTAISYKWPPASGAAVQKMPFLIPPRTLFVLGDNTGNANDSRYWGSLPIENLVGRVRK